MSVWTTRRWRWRSEWFPSLQRLRDRTDLLRFMGGTVDTVNVGSRAPVCPLFQFLERTMFHRDLSYQNLRTKISWFLVAD
jgi:hypothetical protein